MPRVSVLIPCFDAEPFVGQTLTSLRLQTFEDWECVVVDDGSTDRSAGVVEAYAAEDCRIRLIRQANAGVARARNAAYSACSADTAYLLFLDSDDCLEPGMLEVLVGYLDTRPDVALVYSGFTWIGQNNELIPLNDPRLPDFLPTRFVPLALGIRVLPPDVAETPFASIFAAWAGLLPSNSLLRRAVYATTPGWDESLGQPAEDTDLFLHMALRGAVHYLPQALVRYRRHERQATLDRARILAQDRKLFRKWAHRTDLASPELALVNRARWFREARVLPYLSLKIGHSHLRNGNRIEAAKCVLRAVKQVGMALGDIRAYAGR